MSADEAEPETDVSLTDPEAAEPIDTPGPRHARSLDPQPATRNAHA